MKAISIIQPWASLIIGGAKRFETRSWQTAHRGPLVIASSRRFPLEFLEMCDREPFRSALAALALPWKELPLGFLLGAVDVVECHPTCAMPEVTELEAAFGDFDPGRYAWELANPRSFSAPIPFRGALGLFDVPDPLIPAEYR